jgi:Tfp pilus assembly protein PilO
MKEFLKKNRIYISIIAYLMVLGGLCFFVARPIISNITKRNNEIQERIASQEMKKEKLSELPVIRNQFGMLEAQEGKMSIPLNESNVVNLVEKIEKIADDTGNKVKIELPENQDDTKKATKAKKIDDKAVKPILENLPSNKYIKINITLTGKYRNFIDFVKKMENTEYYCDLVSFKISSDNSGASISNPFQDNSNSNDIIIQDKDNVVSAIGAIFYLNND